MFPLCFSIMHVSTWQVHIKLAARQKKFIVSLIFGFELLSFKGSLLEVNENDFFAPENPQTFYFIKGISTVKSAIDIGNRCCRRNVLVTSKRSCRQICHQLFGWCWFWSSSIIIRLPGIFIQLPIWAILRLSANDFIR